jgi:hypothetical protein
MEQEKVIEIKKVDAKEVAISTKKLFTPKKKSLKLCY